MRMRGGDPRADAGAGRTTRRSRGWRNASLCGMAALLLAAAPAFAQAGAATVPQGSPQVDGPLRDPDFGVGTTHPGLQRHVEMYQWIRAGDGYARAWRGARVDSSGFAPGHENPREMPLREREWRAPVTLDGKPLPREVVDALGRWRSFRPDFSALPGNMTATFQPEGDGLGSAENPLAPQVGDLRVTWRELVLPPLGDRLVLREGRWTLREPAPAVPVVDPGSHARASSETGRGWPRWPFVVAAILVVLVLLGVAVRRRRSHS